MDPGVFLVGICSFACVFRHCDLSAVSYTLIVGVNFFGLFIMAQASRLCYYIGHLLMISVYSLDGHFCIDILSTTRYPSQISFFIVYLTIIFSPWLHS